MVYNREFQTSRMTEEGLRKSIEVALAFDNLLRTLDNLTEEMSSSRYMSIVRTNLETASFYAKKAVAFNPQNMLISPEFPIKEE